MNELPARALSSATTVRRGPRTSEPTADAAVLRHGAQRLASTVVASSRLQLAESAAIVIAMALIVITLAAARWEAALTSIGPVSLAAGALLLPSGFLLTRLVHRSAATRLAVIDRLLVGRALMVSVMAGLAALAWPAGATLITAVVLVFGVMAGRSLSTSRGHGRTYVLALWLPLLVMAAAALREPLGILALSALAAAGVTIAAWQDRTARRTARAAVRTRAFFRRIQRTRAEATALLATARAEQAEMKRQRAQTAQFLGAACHDLRQPIHTIGLFLAALDREVVSGQARYLLDRLDRSMQGIDDLFHRLLDVSRLDSGRIDPVFSVFALDPLFKTLESRFVRLAEERGLRFSVRVRTGVYVRSDPALLVEILMNLLSNAFRYTETGGIVLGLRLSKGRALLQVWDTGRGIAPADQRRIFDEFVQLTNPARDRRRGLGLGLSIVRRLTVALECDLSLRSRPGKGSCFEVAMPVVEGPIRSPDADHAGAGEVDLSGLLVMVIDDDYDVLLAMQALLRGWGCFVVLSRTLEELLTNIHASERFPDMVVTDHRLEDGFTSVQVEEAVREAVPVEIPILVVTGDTEEKVHASIRQRGLPMLPKPVNPRALRASIARLCLGVDEAGRP